MNDIDLRKLAESLIDQGGSMNQSLLKLDENGYYHAEYTTPETTVHISSKDQELACTLYAKVLEVISNNPKNQ